MKFQVERRVEFCETDMAGIMHFSNFFRYMEYAEVAFLREGTFGETRLGRATSQLSAAVSAKCDFAKPAKFEDVLQIAVTLEKIGQKSVTFAFEFTRDGETLAKGTTTSVCCKTGENHELEGIPIPDSYRDKLMEPA